MPSINQPALIARAVPYISLRPNLAALDHVTVFKAKTDEKGRKDRQALPGHHKRAKRVSLVRSKHYKQP